MRWCTAHAPAWSGLDDDAVTAEAYLSGSAEAGGADNRRWCEFFHREPEPAKPARARRRRSPAPAPSSAGC